MGKIIFVFAISLITSWTNGQVEILAYTGVVQVDGVSKEQLYNRSRIWLANAYNNSKYVIQMEDKEVGQIIGKARMSYVSSKMMQQKANGHIGYTIKIYVKAIKTAPRRSAENIALPIVYPLRL